MTLAPSTMDVPVERIAYFDLSWDLMLGMCLSGPMSQRVSSLPDDARVHHLVLNHERRMVRVFFTSATLDEVHEAQIIPEVQPTLRTIAP